MTAAKRKAKGKLGPGMSKTRGGRIMARLPRTFDALKGKRVGPSKAFDTLPEAQAWRLQELARLERGEIVGAGSKQELGAFLREFYTEIRKATSGDRVLSRATCEADLALAELYILKRSPGLATTPLAKLTTPMLRQHFQALSTSGLALATVSRVRRILRARLAYAVADGRMRFNPMVGGLIPVGGKKKRARTVMTAEQARAVLAVCPESRIGTFVATILWTGARPGEVAGLTWDDVDFDKRELTIRRALARHKPTDETRGTGTDWELKATKTDTERQVPIPDSVVAMLRRHRLEQVEARVALGRHYVNSNLVFTATKGQPLQLDSVGAEYLKPLLRRAALHLAGETPLPLPPATRAQSYKDAVAALRAQEDAAIAKTGFPMAGAWYAFRHGYGSLMDELRVPLKDIQEMMGHANVATTMGYIHGSPERRRAALETLENAILPKTGKLSLG